MGTGKNLKEERLGATGYNKQGCLMKIVEYNSPYDVVVEFNDKYKSKKRTTYQMFLRGQTKNCYIPTVYGMGIIGDKYPKAVNRVYTKEYMVWQSMLGRCYSAKKKQERPTYKDVICCEEWLLYENFYEWLHGQENFEMWKKEKNFCVDKDILQPNNKVYSPDTCCLIPKSLNSLFRDKNCHLTFDKVKQVAETEYHRGAITKQCYEAVMQWEDKREWEAATYDLKENIKDIKELEKHINSVANKKFVGIEWKKEKEILNNFGLGYTAKKINQQLKEIDIPFRLHKIQPTKGHIYTYWFTKE